MKRIRTGTAQEGYARLPEDLLHDLLGGSDALIQEVEALLGSNLDKQSKLRDAHEDLGLVQRLREREKGTVCGIDGGFAIERTSSVDLSLAVAVGLEGLSETTTPRGGTQFAANVVPALGRGQIRHEEDSTHSRPRCEGEPR